MQSCMVSVALIDGPCVLPVHGVMPGKSSGQLFSTEILVFILYVCTSNEKIREHQDSSLSK